jgi:biotin synthase
MGKDAKMVWDELSRNILAGGSITRGQALAVLQSGNDELLTVLQAAFELRKRYFGRDVTLHVIRNAKSGACSEDCAYCSQSSSATSPVECYPMQTVEKIVEGAHAAHKLSAYRYCVVASGRAPVEKELEMICEAARRIKREVPIQLCTSLGILNPDQARQLKEAGVDRYNHNLETSERHYGVICSTHGYGDRVETARAVKGAGLELCSGGLIGMGETLEDRVDLAFALRETGADSIPVNFLDPRPGTALAGSERIGAMDVLRTLAMFRFVHPDREIRIAGGREACLGPLQALSLFAANSLFTVGYLTTGGQGNEADRKMIEMAGFRIAGIVDTGE